LALVWSFAPFSRVCRHAVVFLVFPAGFVGVSDRLPAAASGEGKTLVFLTDARGGVLGHQAFTDLP